MNQRVLLRRELVVDFDCSLVILAVRFTRYVKNIAFAAERFALFLRASRCLEGLRRKASRRLILAESPLDRGLFVARRPLQLAVFFTTSSGRTECPVEDWAAMLCVADFATKSARS